MELKIEERTVGDFTFEMTMLTATESRKLQTILARALGPSIKALGMKGLSEGAVGEAISNILVNLNDEDLKQVVDKCSRSCRVVTEEGKRPKVSDVYDLFFAGRPSLMWKWLGSCIEFQLADFLEGLDLRSLGEGLMSQFMSTSQSTSTGTSGES